MHVIDQENWYRRMTEAFLIVRKLSSGHPSHFRCIVPSIAYLTTRLILSITALTSCSGVMTLLAQSSFCATMCSVVTGCMVCIHHFSLWSRVCIPVGHGLTRG